jgi:hypothetical protein
MKYLFSFCLFFIVWMGLHAQTNVAPAKLSPDSALQKFRNLYPQEKVFAQTDKETYLSGETIWMKIWCTLDGVPTFLSNILYVDLVNAEGKVVAKKMYKLDSLSSTQADLDLPVTIASGTYSINAYSLWMLNFPDFIFRKSIFIYGTDYLNKKNTATKPQLNCQFFPEAGNLLEGVNTRIAFLVTDQNGQPVNVKGSIADQSGKAIKEVQTLHNGMGIFEIEANGESRYKLNIPLANGASMDYALPVAEKEGVNMRVENSNPNRLTALVFRAEKNKEAYNKIKLVAQMNGQMVASAELNFDEGLTALPIAKKNLPAGILQITAFREDGLPLAERIAFIANYNILQPDIKTPVLSKQARGKNEFSVEFPNIKQPNISLAVTDASMDTAFKIPENIVSSLLLSSDIKGYIHEPAYYFKDKSKERLDHLDLLMMTQGWRRFEWKKMINDQSVNLQYPVESSLVIRGLVKKSDRNAVVGEGHVSFIIKTEDSTTIMASAQLTDKGEFMLDGLSFQKKATFFYQGTNKKKESYIVDVDITPAYIDSLQKSSGIPSVNLDTAVIKAGAAGYAGFLFGKLKSIDTANGEYLGNVTVKGVRKKLSPADSLNAAYASDIFKLGRSIDPSETGFATSIWQIIQRSVPGISVTGDMINPVVRFTRFQGLDALSENNSASYLSASGSGGDDFGTMMLERNGVTYFLNEMNVSMDVISTINVSDVALIKVYAAEGTALGASGPAIAIYTKKGAVTGKNIYDKKFSSIERTGYSLVKSFYAPLYTRAKQPEEALDSRETLYWNGNVKPGKDGKYSFRFYNNDFSKKVKVVIQGIGVNGELIYAEKVF